MWSGSACGSTEAQHRVAALVVGDDLLLLVATASRLSRRAPITHAVAGVLEVDPLRSACAPRRTANSAASLTRLARSAPLMPGVPRATTSRSTSGPIRLSRQCTLRIARRSSSSGSGTTIWRSKRPGRSSAGSRMSGRLVAAIITMPSVASKPSISASIWLSVCSRSSWPPPRPAPRLRPIESISSTKMIARPMLAGLLEQVADAAGADADEHLHEVGAGDRQERHAGLTGDGAGDERLAGAGRADEQHALRDARADLLELARACFRKSTTSVISCFTPLVAGDVGERRRRLVGGVDLGPAAPDGHDVAHLALRRGAASRRRSR